MSEIPPPSQAVVVGIDGSRAAVTAALWAVDEAVYRDIPLRLVYAIEPREPAGTDAQHSASDLAKAEQAVRYALTAVESTDKPVKIELEIVQDRPLHALRQASRSAALLCLGSVGLRHAMGRIGSTAAALATAAHCPVAIVNGHEPLRRTRGWVVAEIDESPTSTTVLERAFEEACLREAPLRVMTTWQSRYTDIHDAHAVSDGNRVVRAQLDRRLVKWRRDHPNLDVQAVATHGTTLNYLAQNASSVQLLVVGRNRPNELADIIGPAWLTAPGNTTCSVLVCDGHGSL